MTLRKLLALAAATAAISPSNAQEMLYVDAAQRGHDINPNMYGIFFEEINHSGDGGLYAEMIQNRGFEEQTIPEGFKANGTNKIQTEQFVRYTDLVRNQLNWDWNYDQKKMTGWSTQASGCTIVCDVTAPTTPLHEATPNAMKLAISGATSGSTAKLINSGYWGMAVDKDENYKLRFYLNTVDYSGKVKAQIMSDGEVIGEAEFDVDKSGNWKEYTGVLTATKSARKATFALSFDGNGSIWVDYVSLFPENTFNGRENGMRPDIAQMLVDLKPKFMRWPGGCIVEGITLANRVRWKETLGDPMTRPGKYDLWGYRTTWGMGYHEILQFCEDTGMDCMFVGNAGLSCCGWGGEYVSGDDVEPYYQEIKDAIEYAIGDPETNEWAARRAAAGHPAPFPLKYVEIGNENFTARYNENYHYIYNKLKAEYPQLIFLNTMGIEHAEEFKLKTDMIDPHWYVAPEFFYNNRQIFDNVPRGNYDIYVGEYATNANVGSGNMDAALSEAVFMMSMERNSDIVKMASYAPLITNDNAPNWSCNLIWQHSGEVFGRASYYTQKLFAENLPSYNIASSLQTAKSDVQYNGRIGIGTWNTAADFRNFKVTTPEGETLYTADFAGSPEQWTGMQGTWTPAADGSITQSDKDLTRCITLMNRLAFRDCVIEVEARKTAGSEGFLITFGCDDEGWDHYYQFNVGGWWNTGVAFESVNNGGGAVISERPSFRIENDRWYKLKVVLHEGKVQGYIDDQLYCSYDFGKTRVGRVDAHAGYDSATGEIVLKVVNAEETAMPLTLKLNATDIASTASVETMKSNGLWDENSFSVPTGIAPVKSTVSGVGETFAYTFDPYSLTVVRIKATPATTAMTIPEAPYSSEPRVLVPTAESGPAARLAEMIAEANAVMLTDVTGYDALRTATNNAKAVLATGDNEGIKTGITALEKALNTYYKAQMIAANELTDRLVNPHFENAGDNSGWSGNPTVNQHVAEKFSCGYNIAQNVDGLESGWYLVYFQGYYRNGSHPDAHERHADGSEELLARFRVNNNEKPVVSLMSEVHDGYWWAAPNSMSEAHTVFSESADYYANYLICPVENGKLSIILSKDEVEANDWFCFDNVRLFRVPSENSGIISPEVAATEFSAEAEIYDLQGRRIGNYAGFSRLDAGVYIISENGRSAKVRR